MTGRRYAAGDRHLRWDIPLAIGAFRRCDIMWKDALVLVLALKDLRLVRWMKPGTFLFGGQRAEGANRLGRWIYDQARQRQRPDPHKHAPRCPANRWAGMELVIQPCNCGAWRYAGVTAAMNRESARDQPVRRRRRLIAPVLCALVALFMVACGIAGISVGAWLRGGAYLMSAAIWCWAVRNSLRWARSPL